MEKSEVLRIVLNVPSPDTAGTTLTERVPEGQLWKVKHLCFFNGSRQCEYFELAIWDGIAYSYIKVLGDIYNSVDYKFYSITWDGEIILKPGEQIYACAQTSVAADEIHLTVLGEKVFV